jgi:hypothetical protein
MEPLSLDYVGAAATYTPWVASVMQIIKQSPKVDNSKLPYLSVVLGVLTAIVMLVIAGKLVWTANGLMYDPASFLKAVMEGTVGGAGAPIAYQIQRQLPIVPLKPGPDNFGTPPPPPPRPPQS